MKNTALLFNCQCGRCAGTGRYDRGTCFDCKGARTTRVKQRPNLPEHQFTITFANGAVNNVTMFFSDRSTAELAIRTECARKKWEIKEIK